MESVLNSFSFLPNRIKSFKGTSFEKNRSKCTSKKMAEAGFYSLQTDSDLVRCFACGIEIQNWAKSSDDPLSIHEKQSPDCLYTKLKGSYSNELTVKEFLEIEKYRCLKMNEKNFEKRTNMIKDILDLVQNCPIDQEIVFTVDENNECQIQTVAKK